MNDKFLKENERFIARLYGDLDDVKEARYRLYASKDISNESQLPPSSNALKYHVRRAAYQIHLWSLALVPVITIPSPVNSGWDQDVLAVM